MVQYSAACRHVTTHNINRHLLLLLLLLLLFYARRFYIAFTLEGRGGVFRLYILQT